jgi:CMP-N-acetylneuraminic acid synthetase
MPYDTNWITDATPEATSTAGVMPEPGSRRRSSIPRPLDSPRLWVVVPARKGSKGVPNKNFRPLGAEPLWLRAVNCGRTFAMGVIVSSDLDPPFPSPCVWVGRPPELATDKTPMWAVLSHLSREYRWRDEDIIVLLQPSSLHPDRATIARKMFAEGVLPACTVVRYPDKWHPWYAQCPQNPHSAPACRQGLPSRFRPDGLVYILSGATARRESFWNDHPKFYEVEGTLTIDTPEDWAEAERQYGTV